MVFNAEVGLGTGNRRWATRHCPASGEGNRSRRRASGAVWVTERMPGGNSPHVIPGEIALVDEVADFRERSLAHLHAQQAGAFGRFQLAFEVFDRGEPQLGLLPQHAHQAGAIRDIGEVAGNSTGGLDGQEDGLCGRHILGARWTGGEIDSHGNEIATHTVRAKWTEQGILLPLSAMALPSKRSNQARRDQQHHESGDCCHKGFQKRNLAREMRLP